MTLAVLALVGGAIAVGFSPILVRWAEVGPFASAFWRVALALPALYLWMLADKTPLRSSELRETAPILVLAGLLFAGDLFFWHLAILATTVANATLFANLAPVVVTLGAWLILKEHITKRFLLGLALTLAGASLLLGASFDLDPSHLEGDVYGMLTACFFGAYILAVRSVRGRVSAASLMFWSGLVTAAVLLPVALLAEPTIWPASSKGWLALLALGLVCHAGGQGLLAVGLGHAPASFSSVVILLESLAAAIFGWLFLSEAITGLQALGGLVILAGILTARHATREARAADARAAP